MADGEVQSTTASASPVGAIANAAGSLFSAVSGIFVSSAQTKQAKEATRQAMYNYLGIKSNADAQTNIVQIQSGDNTLNQLVGLQQTKLKQNSPLLYISAGVLIIALLGLLLYLKK